MSVVEAAQHFAVTRGYARSTVQTIMERLRSKDHLTRRKSRGVYRYSARVGRADLLQALVHEFVGGALGGSVSPFVAYLASGAKLGDEELNELAQLVEQLQSQRKESTP